MTTNIVPQVKKWLSTLGIPVDLEKPTLSAEEYDQYRGVVTHQFGVEAHKVKDSLIFPDILPSKALNAIMSVDPDYIPPAAPIAPLPVGSTEADDGGDDNSDNNENNEPPEGDGTGTGNGGEGDNGSEVKPPEVTEPPADPIKEEEKKEPPAPEEVKPPEGNKEEVKEELKEEVKDQQPEQAAAKIEVTDGKKEEATP